MDFILCNLHYEKFADGSVKCIEDEIPFELPEGWAWERLGNVSTIARGGSPRPIEDYLTDDTDGINWIKIGDTEKDGKYIVHTKEKIKPAGLSKTRYVHDGDFLLTNSMSFGRPYILKTDGCIHDGWLVIGDIDTVFNQDYLYYALSSGFMYTTLSLLAAGSTVKNLKSDTVRSVLFPIPPLGEQERMARRLEQLISFVDAINIEKRQLVDIINQTKSKILDLAIRGQLVSQDPNDEPASALLERIRAEKEKLIKAGKIKRDHKESIIFKGEDNSYYEKMPDEKLHCIDDQLPFDLPDGWEWCNLSMIGTTNIGLTYRPTDITPDGVMVLRSCNIVNDQIDLSDLVRVNTNIRENQFVKQNDILICARNGSKALVGKCALIPKLEGSASFGAFMAIYRTFYFEYIVQFLRSDFFRSVFDDGNSTTINQLTQDMLKRAIVPFPPLPEQRKIVEAINAMYSKLNVIEESLS